MRTKMATICSLLVLFVVNGFFLTGTLEVWAAESSPLSFLPPGRYMFVKERSSVSAYVRSTLRNFDTVAPKFTGELVIPSGSTLKEVRFHFEFKIEDLETGNFLRDGAMHVLALEVEKYPKSVFDARSVQFTRKDKTGWQFRVM